MGALADRLDRRAIVLAGLFGMLILGLLLGWLGLTGRLEIWHLMLGAFVGGMGVAFLGRATAHGRIYFYGAAAAGAGLILAATSIGAGCVATMQPTLMLLLAPPEVRSRLMACFRSVSA